jgi:hypothetical protein
MFRLVPSSVCFFHLTNTTSRGPLVSPREEKRMGSEPEVMVGLGPTTLAEILLALSFDLCMSHCRYSWAIAVNEF